MQRLLQPIGLVVASLAGGCGAEPDCSFEHVVAEDIAGLELLDCGDLPAWDSITGPEPDAVRFRAAHDCAVAAWSSLQPFVVRWRIPQIEGTEEVAFVARSVDGALALTSFVNGVRVDASPTPTVRYGCSNLLDRGTCADVTRTLCLDCAGRTVVERCGQ